MNIVDSKKSKCDRRKLYRKERQNYEEINDIKVLLIPRSACRFLFEWYHLKKQNIHPNSQRITDTIDLPENLFISLLNKPAALNTTSKLLLQDNTLTLNNILLQDDAQNQSIALLQEDIPLQNDIFQDDIMLQDDILSEDDALAQALIVEIKI
ncbi:5691_t:CDS:2 [Gigaspora margarita]|uniref:5691_t:CDS:1 n=1 Tax=Gigaspora margarita TaxID=4874 RepID=A0ABN7VPR5_GIGMA|nr:5691_t:CDS:2 [Gigaspora margarita]